jgi:UDP-N-acetylglucosamine transferase subunit ALG13
VRLAPRLHGLDDDAMWVTWDAPQSRSLLEGRRCVFVRPTPPRSPVAVSSNFDHAIRLWRDPSVTGLVTTGSQVALPFIIVGRLRGRSCHFIESAARAADHSLTARLVARVPGVKLYTQYPAATDRSWRYAGSVFDGYEPISDERSPKITKAVVTLGTMPGWGFRRMVEAVRCVLPPDVDTLWQTGATDVSELGLKTYEAVSATELESAVRDADVVISHAGVGSALVALESGKCPILIPRSAAHGEHVDDHQHQIATDLSNRGLALARSPESLRFADLIDAARRRVVSRNDQLPFELDAAVDSNN